jgi:MFS family permease
LEADPSSRGTYAGLFEGSIGLGYLLGPGIGGLAAEFVLEGPYVMSSVVALSASALLAKDWGGTE